MFQKPWRLATEVGWGLNEMSDPILNLPPKAAKWGCNCVPKALAACNLGGMGFKCDVGSNPKPARRRRANGLATVFQKPWRLATEVGWGLNEMTIPILIPHAEGRQMALQLCSKSPGGLQLRWDGV